MNKARIFRFAIFLILIQIACLSVFSQNRSKNDQVDFIYHQRLIFLKMQVNNEKDLLFLLDTGASASALNLKTADRLKIPFTGTGKIEGTAGTIETKKVTVKSLSIDKAKAKNLTFPAYDLSGLLAPPGMSLDGILGYDFLGSFIINIDFANQTIAFLPKNSKNIIKNGSAVIPFNLDNNIPRLTATLNDGITTDFRLDTGASIFETRDVYLNVPEGIWKKLTAVDPDLKPERYFTGGGVGGEIKLPVARINSFSAGKIVFPKPFVIVQPKTGYFAREDAVGFISNNFLEKFSPVVVNYPQKTLYLTVK